MTLMSDSLELWWPGGSFGLSARRIWEHAELGQVNVFGKTIDSQFDPIDVAGVIDLIQAGSGAFTVSGFTLSDLRRWVFPSGTTVDDFPYLLNAAEDAATKFFEREVAAFLQTFSARKATRNQGHRFLPPAQSGDLFAVPFLHSALQCQLVSMGRAKANADQWLRTIANFQKKGVRAEEFERANLLRKLATLDTEGTQATAAELAGLCSFEELRLSVIPVMSDARRQLQFSSTPPKWLKRTKKLPKAQLGQTRAPIRFDPILGYRIEQVEHLTLWGSDQHWQAVAPDGQVIKWENGLKLLATMDDAAELAAAHAKMHYPKRTVLGRWGEYAWTGGADYREWLITLPYFPATYFSSHFTVRNVLAHVRCDEREGVDRERILLLQEVQSDWAQTARRAINRGEMDPSDDDCPPFMKEWPTLVMKLILLHASHQGFDAVAWTLGTHQAERYRGLGAFGLAELYDQTLPREVNRMLKSMGGTCQMLDVFVPTNFRVKQTENGYEVYSADNVLLGTAPTYEDARAFVPDGARELLYEVHGVKLSVDLRKKILSTGFPAWG